MIGQDLGMLATGSGLMFVGIVIIVLSVLSFLMPWFIYRMKKNSDRILLEAEETNSILRSLMMQSRSLHKETTQQNEKIVRVLTSKVAPQQKKPESNTQVEEPSQNLTMDHELTTSKRFEKPIQPPA